MKRTAFSHEFIELMPSELNESTLYVSIPYATAIHLCACGCGIKVVTPITPPEWHLTWDGDSVSLYPSIGNWQFPCRSHYWIRRNHIIWAGDMSQREIAEARMQDSQQLKAYFSGESAEHDRSEATPAETPARETFIRRLRRILPKRRYN